MENSFFLCKVAVKLKTQSLLDGLMGAMVSTVWIPSSGVKKNKQFALFVLELHLDDAGIQPQHGKALPSWSPGGREGVNGRTDNIPS